MLLLSSLFVSFLPMRRGADGAIKTIVIDAGHGGLDPGCHGVNFKEKDISLAVALKLGKILEEYYGDVKVVYTRKTDVFVELEDRAQIANKAKADLFISIHCNAAGKAVVVKDSKTGKKRVKMYKNKKGKYVPVETTNPVPFGTETYVMGLKNEAGKMKVAQRENSAMLYEDNYETKYGGFDPESEESYIIMSNYTSSYVIQSANLALKIQEEYTKKAGRIDKGVHRQSIWVLWRTSMPSILTEIGYLTNPIEEVFLGSEQGQDYLAKAIFRGVRRYKDEVEGNKKTYNDEYENQAPLENENIKAGNLPTQKNGDEEDEGETKSTADSSGKTGVSVTEKNLAKKDSSTDASREEYHSAKDIAEKVKNRKKNTDKDSDKSSVDKLPPKEEAITFAVQFATSPVELNLSESKYSQIINGGYYKQNGVFKYTSGNYPKFKSAVAHQGALRQNGFPDCFVIALKGGHRMDLKKKKKLSGQ